MSPQLDPLPFSLLPEMPFNSLGAYSPNMSWVSQGSQKFAVGHFQNWLHMHEQVCRKLVNCAYWLKVINFRVFHRDQGFSGTRGICVTTSGMLSLLAVAKEGKGEKLPICASVLGERAATFLALAADLLRLL